MKLQISYVVLFFYYVTSASGSKMLLYPLKFIQVCPHKYLQENKITYSTHISIIRFMIFSEFSVVASHL